MQVQSLSDQSSFAGAGAVVESPLLRGQLGFIAKQLGLSTEDLHAALAKGSSLDALSRRQGIAPADLRRQVAANIASSRAQAGQAEVDPERLGRILDRAFASGSGPREPHRGDPHAAYGAATIAVPQEPARSGISIIA